MTSFSNGEAPVAASGRPEVYFLEARPTTRTSRDAPRIPFPIRSMKRAQSRMAPSHGRKRLACRTKAIPRHGWLLALTR